MPNYELTYTRKIAVHEVVTFEATSDEEAKVKALEYHKNPELLPTNRFFACRNHEISQFYLRPLFFDLY